MGGPQAAGSGLSDINCDERGASLRSMIHNDWMADGRDHLAQRTLTIGYNRG